MYTDLVRQLQKTLRNLDAILGKAQKNAEARGFPVDNFMTQRLAPDMLPFPRQVQIACDHAKNCAAAVAGVETPKFPDEEKSVAELRERIAKTLAFIDGLSFGDADANAVVKVPNPPGKAMRLHDAVYSRWTPNFFFHASMAYAILRAGGVDVGKRDWLGELALFDA
ncbi:MAG: DUF1993 domain-containing protein [Myxococcota bacterium]